MTKGQVMLFVTITVVVIVVICVILFIRKFCLNGFSLFGRKTVRVNRERKAIVKDNRKQKIPRRIMQTNSSSSVPVGMKTTIDSILDLNPEYDYFYYDNEAVREFLEKEYGHRLVSAYDELIPGAYKADLFRYCYLYKRGGIYVDTGMTALKPFRELIRKDDTFVAPEDNGNKISVYNAFMCSTPGHPILGKAIQICLINIEARNKTTDMLCITGPGVLGEAFRSVLKDDSPFIPNTDYGNGVRMIRHIGGNKLHKDPNDIVGEIDDDGIVFLKTKYPEYYSDRKWYHKTEHYGVLWNQDRVFQSVVENRRSEEINCSSERVPPLEDQILVKAISRRPPKSRKGLRDQLIPRLIVQTNEEKEVPIAMFKAMKSILDDNPEYEYEYYDAASRRKFIKKNSEKEVLNAYDSIVPGAFKADLFRYVFLYTRGGVYIDSGMISRAPLRKLISAGDELIIPEDDGRARTCNGFICAIPRLELFRLAIKEIVNNVKTNYYGGSALDITGPNLLGKIFESVYGVPAENGKYCAPNVKIIEYVSSLNLTGNKCPATGTIFFEKKPILDTKYPGYYSDRKWYLTGQQYDFYWQLRQMYA